MLTRRTAAKVFAGDENGGATVPRLIQNKIRVRFSIRQVAPIKEQEFAKPGPFNSLEELLGNDLISVDVRTIERNNEAGVFGERVHKLSDFGLGMADLQTGTAH